MASVVFGAEVTASWWVWREAPTDSIRVWYPSFCAFEAGRLHYWLPVFVFLLTLWISVSYALLRHARPITWLLFGIGSGLGLELTTSILYWTSPRSSSLRSLYQSIWAWDRVPPTNAAGWPSLRIYIWHHIAPWAMVLMIGVSFWYLWNKLRYVMMGGPDQES